MTAAARAYGSVGSMQPPHGFFVVFDGCEGAGKSTQAQLLAVALRDAGHEVVLTREPGGTPVGEAVRSILLDPMSGDIDAKTEALLFAAARANHVSRLINPALARGAIVVCDRFVASSLAYQGAGRGLGLMPVGRISEFATGGLRADLIIVLDIDPTVGLDRASAHSVHDRIEAEGLAFHQTVRKTFLDLARQDPDRHLVVDASRNAELIGRQLLVEVERHYDRVVGQASKQASKQAGKQAKRAQ